MKCRARGDRSFPGVPILTTPDQLTLDLTDFLNLFPQRAPLITWLLGAGTSVSAGLPSAATLTWEFKRALYCVAQRVSPGRFPDLFEPHFQQLVQSYFDARTGYPPAGDQTEYSAYFEAYLSDEQDRRRFLASRLQGCKPSYGHTCLAGLVVLNKARVVWTTNFDSLVEMACNHPSILDRLPRPLGVVGLDQPQKAVDLLRDEQWPVLVKLHGDFYYRRLKNTTAELQTQDSALRHLLSDACARQGIAVIGYSGRDASIMSALTEALHAPQPFPHGLFWFVRSSELPYPAVTELLMQARQKGVQAALVRISTFDELMADLFMPYQDGLPDVRDHVRDLRPLRRPFPTSYSGNGWPVLRSNALRIEEHPASCTLFQATIGSTSDIKKVTASHLDNLIVLRRKQGLIAFGTRASLSSVFAPFSPSGFDRYTIEERRLRYDSAELGLIYHAIVQGISHATGLARHNRGRSRLLFLPSPKILTGLEQVALKSLGSQAVWRMGQGKILHEAIRLSVEFRDQRLWLLIEPTIVVTQDDGQPYVGADRSQIVRESLVRRYNGPSNQFLQWWIDFLKRLCGSPLRIYFPSQAEPEASFVVSTTTAFARKE